MTRRLKSIIDDLGAETGKSVECGWMVDEVAWFLHALIGLARPEVVVQTGHLWGKSACVILDALKYNAVLEGPAPQGDGVFGAFINASRQERPKLGRLISIDPAPLGVANPNAGYDLLGAEFPGQFEHYAMSSEQFFLNHGSRLQAELQGKSVLGVIDGDHTVKGCTLDLMGLAGLGAQLLFVDDLTFIPELAQVCQDFAVSAGYNFLNLPYLNGVGLLVRR